MLDIPVGIGLDGIGSMHTHSVAQVDMYILDIPKWLFLLHPST